MFDFHFGWSQKRAQVMVWSRSFVRHWHILLLALIALPLLVYQLPVYPAPWFDEGFTTHAARVMAESGLYGTYTSKYGYAPFDSAVSSGPTVVLPTALSFVIFGPGMSSARTVSLVITLIGLLSLYAVLSRAFGRATALLAVLALFFFPQPREVRFIDVSRQILGEPIALGLIWLGTYAMYRGWEAANHSKSILAGVIFGFAVLAKSQIAVYLLPALGMVTLLRLIQHRKRKKQFLFELLPPVCLLAVFFAWRMIEYYGQPTQPELQAQNARNYANAFELLFFTHSFGQLLSRTGWALTLMMVAVALTSFARIKVWQLWRSSSPAQDMEVLFAALVLFNAAWFALESVGWLRYAYTGFVTTVILLARHAYNLFQIASRRLSLSSSLSRILAAAICATIALAGIAVNIRPIVFQRHANHAQEVSDFMRAQIKPNAVVETWEWELDALSGHWQVHHPSEDYDFEAVRQIFHLKQPRPYLEYDELQADPDYLVTGVMSDWTGIYDDAALQQHFHQIAQIGPYRVFERINR